MNSQAQGEKRADEFEAMRDIVKAAEPFDDEVRLRIFRYVADKLGVKFQPGVGSEQPVQPRPAIEASSGGAPVRAKDVRSFLAEKSPRADTQKAAAVAYYYRFVAPEQKRKDTIGADDLQEAMRMANFERFKSPIVPLNNAVAAGLLDRAERGAFRINSVGENLVAMLLPDGGAAGEPRRRKKHRKNGNAK